MSDFPELSREPNVTNFTQSLVQDPTLVSDFENGFQLARAQYKNVALKFELVYSFLDDADKILLEQFEKDRSYRVGEFNWVNPTNDLTYIVRFDKNLIFAKERSVDNFYNVKIILVEIRPNTSIDQDIS